MANGGAVIPTIRGHANYKTPSVPILLSHGRTHATTTTRWKRKKRLLAISSSAPTLPTSIRKAPINDLDDRRCYQRPNPRRRTNDQASYSQVLTCRGYTKDDDNKNSGQRNGYKKTGMKPYPSVLLGAAPPSYPTGSFATSGEIARCAVEVSALSNSLPAGAITQRRRPGQVLQTTATGSLAEATGSSQSGGSDVLPTAKKKRAIAKNVAAASTMGYGAYTGPGEIWRCPTTSSLREEAVANPGSVSNKPRLWRSSKPCEVRNAARDELETMKSRFKAEKKRQNAGAGGRFLATIRREITEDVIERWMRQRALLRSDRFTVAQKRELQKWFDSLDKDGSGEIGSSELSNPLLSTGIARSALEVDELVRQVDRDGSGEISFQEFLAVLQRRRKTASSSSVVQLRKHAQKSVIEKIVTLQEVKETQGSDMQTVVAIERRSVLMREILDEANYREAVLEDVTNRRYLAERDGDEGALKALDAAEARLERRRAEKNLYIQAVIDATNFEEERQNVNDALESYHRQPQANRSSSSTSSTSITPASSDDGGGITLTPHSEEYETFQHDEPYHPLEGGTAKVI